MRLPCRSMKSSRTDESASSRSYSVSLVAAKYSKVKLRTRAMRLRIVPEWIPFVIIVPAIHWNNTNTNTIACRIYSSKWIKTSLKPIREPSKLQDRNYLKKSRRLTKKGIKWSSVWRSNRNRADWKLRYWHRKHRIWHNSSKYSSKCSPSSSKRLNSDFWA